MKKKIALLGKYRWLILSLVFFATTINYLDRNVISLLKDDYLEKQFNWSESDYANLVIVFQITYAIGMLWVGWFIDKVGTKIGYSLSMIIWSIAAISHALAKSNFGFLLARGLLGISEAGNFPAAIKTVSEWFPKKERALATAIFNSGTNVGAIIAPLSVPLIAASFGWQLAFIITGAIGFLWLLFWLRLYTLPNENKFLQESELNHIKNDKDEIKINEENKISWIKLLTVKQTWAFIIGKFLTDPIWWFYLFWLPSFLNKQFNMTKTDMALPIAFVYSLTTIGSIYGGWLSGNLIKKGFEDYKARKITMLIFALTVIPVVFANSLGQINPWYAILLIGIAAASHQAWSANIFTTVSDMFPKKAVASVVGIGGMAGAIGGILIAQLAGKLFDYYKSLNDLGTGYFIMFIICGTSYIIAWSIFYLILVPKRKDVIL